MDGCSLSRGLGLLDGGRRLLDFERGFHCLLGCGQWLLDCRRRRHGDQLRRRRRGRCAGRRHLVGSNRREWRPDRRCRRRVGRSAPERRQQPSGPVLLAHLPGGSGWKRQHRVVVVHGPGGVAHRLVGLAAADEGEEIAVGQPQCLVEIGERTAEIALQAVHLASAAPDEGVAWIQPDRFVEIDQRPAEVALQAVRLAARAVGPGVAGIEPDRLAEVGDGAVVFTLRAVRGAALAVRKGKAAIEP